MYAPILVSPFQYGHISYSSSCVSFIYYLVSMCISVQCLCPCIMSASTSDYLSFLAFIIIQISYQVPWTDLPQSFPWVNSSVSAGSVHMITMFSLAVHHYQLVHSFSHSYIPYFLILYLTQFSPIIFSCASLTRLIFSHADLSSSLSPK